MHEVVTDEGTIRTDVVVNAGRHVRPEIGRHGRRRTSRSCRWRTSTSSPRPRAAASSRCRRCATPTAWSTSAPEVGGLIMGGYERDPAPWALDGVPRRFNNQLLPEDWHRFEPLIEAAVDARAGAGRRRGAQARSTAPRRSRPTASSSSARSRWRASGWPPGSAPTASPARAAMGQVMAEWIVERRAGGRPLADGHPPLRRASTAAAAYTLARALEVYSTYYDIEYPNQERTAGRPLRLSAGLRAPARARRRVRREVRLGAGQLVRAERRRRRRGPAAARAGRASYWSPAIGAEHRRLPRAGRALRRVVVRQDRGARARAPRRFLQRLCANDVDRRAGHDHVHADAQRARRDRVRLHGDARWTSERFRIVTGTAFGQHDLSWIRSPLPARRRLGRRARTSRRRYACLGLWGRWRATILQPLHDGGPLERGVPVPARRQLTVGDVPVPGGCGSRTWASSAGSSTARPSTACRLWDTLWEAGRAPRHRRRRLPGDRLAAAREGLPGVGRGHHAGDTPLLGRARVRREARQGVDFIGRDAAGARERPPSRRLRLPRPGRPARRSRSAPSRCASTARSPAGSRAAATATRSAARSRTPTCRPTPPPGTAVEVEVFGERVTPRWSPSRSGPARRAHPSVDSAHARLGARDTRRAGGAPCGSRGRGDRRPLARSAAPCGCPGTCSASGHAVGAGELGFWGLVLTAVFLAVGLAGRAIRSWHRVPDRSGLAAPLGEPALARADAAQLRRHPAAPRRCQRLVTPPVRKGRGGGRRRAA